MLYTIIDVCKQFTCALLLCYKNYKAHVYVLLNGFNKIIKIMHKFAAATFVVLTSPVLINIHDTLFEKHLYIGD